MVSYVGDFGIERVIGVGEGKELYNRSDATVHNFGAFNQMVVDITIPEEVSELPKENARTSFGRGIAGIPANSVIVKADLIVRSMSGTAPTVEIGLFKEDGTAIDQDGLFASAEIAAGHTELTGALVGKNIGADKGFIKFTPSNVNAGLKLEAKLIVTYA